MIKASHSKPEAPTKLCKTNLLTFDHMTTDQLQQIILYWKLTILALQFTEAVSRLFFNAAISWQLNAAPYLCSVHKPCPLLLEETLPWSTRLCTSVIPRTMIEVFSLGMRLMCAHAFKMASYIMDSSQSVVNGFY